MPKAGGSRDHADAVMKTAKWLLSKLSKKNTFKPMVLAKVSRADGSYVGSSLTVTKFLRPLYLHKRISDFKHTLKKAIIFDKVLRVNSQNWSSSAYNGKKYAVSKPPCQNCRKMFGNLEGFLPNVPNDDNLEENSGKTILGLCAEYCAVNELLPNGTLSKVDAKAVDEALTRHYNRCTNLFKDFKKIVHDPLFTDSDVYQPATETFKIFGYTSEWNDYF